jgi:hypothetical protein
VLYLIIEGWREAGEVTVGHMVPQPSETPGD